MNKLTGWILIVVCSFFLLSFGMVLILLIPGILNGKQIEMSGQEVLTSLFGFLIMISLFIIGLKSGIKKVKKEKLVDVVEYEKELNIHLTGQISYKDYRNLIFGLSFRRPIYLVVLGIVLMWVLSFLNTTNDMVIQSSSDYFLIFPIVVMLLIPFFTLFQIKRIYNTSKIFQEKLDYYLTNEAIRIKGETVDSTQKWAHFYQIRVTNRFFMFYQGKLVATLLDKKMFSESELQEFTEFIKSLNVKTI